MDDNIQNAGDVFVKQLFWLQYEVKRAEEKAQHFKKDDSYISLAGSIEENMSAIRQMYNQLEKRYDELCEVAGYRPNK